MTDTAPAATAPASVQPEMSWHQKVSSPEGLEGADACRRHYASGEPDDKAPRNPYPANTLAWQCWNSGWNIVDPQALGGQLPCACCGELAPAAATVCPECGGDPAADLAECHECGGDGTVVVTGPTPWEEKTIECPKCEGRRVVPSLWWEERQAARRAAGVAA